MFCERCGFVYLAEMRIVFSPGSGDAKRRMMRRRRGDAVYYVGETDTVFQMIEATPGSFHIALLLSSFPSLSLASFSGCPVLPSSPLRCEILSEPHSGTAQLLSLSVSLSVSLTLSNFFFSASLLSFVHLLVSLHQCQALENTTQVLPVCILHK